MPVYADVLFVVNGFINYLLLLCNMKILKLNTTRVRLLLGAVAGSIFSLKIFLPEIPQYAEVIIRLVFVTIIVACSYKFASVREFFKASVGFLGVNFGFSGVMISIIYFINPPDLIYDNGVVYYNISFINVILLSCTGFCIITLSEKILKKKVNTQFIYETSVVLNNKTVTGRGLADTGNCLKEPFSGHPVIVADYISVKDIIPPGVKNYIENTDILSADTKSVRIVPINTVSGTGLLPAFKADKIILKGTDKTVIKDNIFVAVSKEKLCHGEFEFILNNSILEVTENEQTKKTDKKNTVKT